MRYDSNVRTPAGASTPPGRGRYLYERLDVSNNTCSVNNCERPNKKRGMCGMHYLRQWRSADFTPHVPKNASECVVPGCTQPQRAAPGWCNMHYQRHLRNGVVGNPEVRALRGVRIIDDKRHCSQCREWLPLADFGVDRTMSDGLKSACRECTSFQMMLWMHNLTRAGYKALLVAQGGVCAVCGDIPVERFHVDHDHACCPGKKSCGKCTRELLCRLCNAAIGLLRDDPHKAANAAVYLLKWAHLKEVG